MKFRITYLINLQALLFGVFLLITFYFNRFAVDDYHFIGKLRTSSFQEIYHYLYFEWHGRWTSNFLLVYFLKFAQFPFFLLIYNSITVGLLFLGIHRLLKAINNYYVLNVSSKTLFIYSGISVSVLFFCSISSNDTWLWYTSTIVYLWSTIAFFFGLSIFFKRNRNYLDYLLFGLSAIYIGGSNEPLTFLTTIALLYLIVKKKDISLASFALVLLIGSFLINFLSPGTLNRDEITPNLNAVDLILFSGYSVVKFLFFTIYKTFIPALFMAFPFYLLGKKNDPRFTINFKPLKELIISLMIIALAVILNQVLVVYALGGLTPDRSSIASTIVVTLVLTRYLFLLGNYHQKKYNNLKYILVLNVVALLVFNGYYAQIHYNYANAVDERIEFIKKSDEEIIIVEPLPDSGYLYSAEITTDASNFKNEHLKNGLGIQADIVLITDR